MERLATADSEHVSEFKYFGYESGTGGAECSRKVASGRRVVGAITSLVNDMDLQLECASLAWNIACTFSYVWQWDDVIGREGEIWIKAVQMDNLRELLGIRRMDSLIRELWGVKKGLDKRIGEGVFRWFGHVKRMESLYRGVLVVVHQVGRWRD